MSKLYRLLGRRAHHQIREALGNIHLPEIGTDVLVHLIPDRL
jgi:hypothetical protein